MRCLCSPGGVTEHCTIVGHDAVLLCTAVAQWYNVTLHRNSAFNKYRYTSLNDADTFSEIRRYAISSLCEGHRVYLHKPR